MCLPQVMGGIAIAKGLTDYGASKRQANMQYTAELEKQSLQQKNYLAEKEGRYLELVHQTEQLRNADLETDANEAGQKGDIALAAQAAKSRMMASQASSGLAAGEGTFGNLLQSIGFEQARAEDTVSTNAGNQRVQTITERRGAELGARVPLPHVSPVMKPNFTPMAIGTGLSIVSSLAGVQDKYGKLNSLGHAWSR